MPRSTKTRSGFTLIEVLITIGVVSVAFLGTMAALAFGMTASRDTAQHTQALNFNRRVLELVYSRARLFEPIAIGAPADPAAAADSPDWRQLYYLPNRPDGKVSPTGLNVWFELSDWYPVINSPECVKFQLEEEKFQMNLSRTQTLVDGVSAPAVDDHKSGIWRVVAQTRWREKVGARSNNADDASKWRFVRTEAAIAPN